MAATSNPLIWSFNRQLTNTEGANVGGVAHYYDGTAQTIFINSNGMYTRLSTPTEGDWMGNALSTPSQAVDQVIYSALGIDHPVNGTLYFAANMAGQLRFMRYIYALDISDICPSVTYTQQIDNPITQISANVANVDNGIFDSDYTLFNPGAKLTLGVRYGEGDVYPISVAYVDDCTHDPKAATVPISGRNSIGYYLKESTFGSSAGDFTGMYHEIMAQYFALAGIKKYKLMTGDWTNTMTPKASDTILTAIDYLQNIAYYSQSNPMSIRESADGTVLAGYASWMDTYLPNGYYTFTVGSEIFKRKTKKADDAAYSGVYVTGKTADNTDLTPVQVSVNNYTTWYLPSHKLKHVTAPANINTQAKLQWYANLQAAALQYVGIGEEFTSPLLPHLLVGDVAEINDSGTGITLGIITEVKHTMGRAGFTTMFSVDSGGTVTTTDGVTRTTACGAYGYNRKQRMTDIINKIAGN